MNAKNLVLSGSPGVGKTTLIKEATLPLRAGVGGFYTEQIIEAGKRLGFRIKTLDGREAVLASKAMASPCRLNKYGVDVAALDRVGVAALLEALERRRVVVIDEIGAMEAMSAAFREACMKCLLGPKPVLATIRKGAHEFTDAVKRLEGTRMVELTRAGYPGARALVKAWLEEALA